MSQFREVRGIALEAMAGSDIGKCIKEAIVMAKDTGKMVLFSFNDTPVQIRPENVKPGYADQLCREYFEAREPERKRR